MTPKNPSARHLSWWALCCITLLLIACGGGGGDRGGDAPSPPGPPVRLAVEPGALLMTQSGERRTLSAKAFDAEGREVPVAVTWTSSDPAVVAVAEDGEAAARVAVGSARLIATAGALRTTVPVVVARTAAGAVLLEDRQIAKIEAVDPEAVFGIGYRMRVTLQDAAAPAVGRLVLGTGALPVGGRVVAVAEGAMPPQITVEVRPIGELFDELRIRESWRLADLAPEIDPAVEAYYTVTSDGAGRYSLRQKADRPIRASATRKQAQGLGRRAPAAEVAFERGPLACSAEGGATDFELTASSVDVDATEVRVDFEWSGGNRRLLLIGTPKFNFAFKPLLSAGLTGEFTCKLTAFTLPVPAPAILGALAGASVPLGAGFAVEGTVPVGGLGFEATAEYTYRLRAGVECTPQCSLPREFERTGTQASFKWVEPALPAGVTVEAEARVFGFADLHVGARGLGRVAGEAIGRVVGVRVADLEFLTLRGGLALEGHLASEDTQAADTDFAAQYKLGVEFALAPGEDLQEALALLEIVVSPEGATISSALGASPTATALTADRRSFAVGDTVTFAIELAGTSFPLAGYNVEAVRVYRKQVVGSATTLVLAGEVQATAGQTRFEIPWVATVEGVVAEGSGNTLQSHFVAFVRTRLLDTRLELGAPAVADDGVRWLAGVVTEESRETRVERSDLKRLVWNLRVATRLAEDLTGEEISGTVDYFDRYEFWGESDIDGTTFCKHATVTLTGQLTVSAYDHRDDSDPATGLFTATGTVSGTRVDHEGCDRNPGSHAVAPFVISVSSLAGSDAARLPQVVRDAEGELRSLVWDLAPPRGDSRTESISGRLDREP